MEGSPEPGFAYAQTCSVFTPVPRETARSITRPATRNGYVTSLPERRPIHPHQGCHLLRVRQLELKTSVRTVNIESCWWRRGGARLIVADATVLIALAKIQRLAILRRLFRQVLVGPVVQDEVVARGRAISAAGVEQVERGIEDGWIELARVSAGERKLMESILSKSRLDRGEAECLALAKSRKLRLIVDDKEARAHAEAMALEYIGTAAALLEAFMRHHLSMDELEDSVGSLSKVTWLSPAVVSAILTRAREIEK